MRMLILSYMKQVAEPNVCTKFQNPTCSSSWEIFDMEWDMEKRKKESKINFNIVVFFYTIYFNPQ